MKITKEMLEQKKLQAQQANNIGWLDTVKMETYGIKTSKPMKLTGWERPEKPFQECQTKKPFWGF